MWFLTYAGTWSSAALYRFILLCLNSHALLPTFNQFSFWIFIQNDTNYSSYPKAVSTADKILCLKIKIVAGFESNYHLDRWYIWYSYAWVIVIYHIFTWNCNVFIVPEGWWWLGDIRHPVPETSCCSVLDTIIFGWFIVMGIAQNRLWFLWIAAFRRNN